MTKVIGVFGNDTDMDIALNRLYEQGFDDVQVVDRSYEVPVVTPEVAVTASAVANNGLNPSGGLTPVPLFMPGFFGLADASITGDYFRNQTNFPEMSAEEAEWYARAVREGGKLVIIDTDEDHVASVRHVLLNSNAGQYAKL